MTVEELRARKRDLLTRKKHELELQARGEGDGMALYLINEELLDLDSQIHTLAPIRPPKRPKTLSAGDKDWTLDRSAFLDWQHTGQDSGSAPGNTWAQKCQAAGQALACLTPRQRQVLELEVNGENTVKIAALLGLNKSSVSRTLKRAKDAMRKRMERKRTVEKIRRKSHVIDLSDPAMAKTVLWAMTSTQAVYFYLYFSLCLHSGDICQVIGKNKSTISRSLRRGLKNIAGFLDGEKTVLVHPEALEELVYPIYLELEAHPERLPPKNLELKKYKTEAEILLKSKRSVIFVEKPEKGGCPAGKLLAALQEQAENTPRLEEDYVFSRLEEVFRLAIAGFSRG